MGDLIIKHVTKQFGSFVALKDVSLTFEANKIYGLLGRNGAGKSTLLNIVTNKLFPEAGEVTLGGQSVQENDEAQRNIYCMREQNLYPDKMKVKDVFKWSAGFYPNFDLEYANILVEKFQLPLNKTVKSLSTGYGSIYKIIVALSCHAPILLFDEPVLGLDAYHRDLFYKELLVNYSKHPKTIVISTHLIEEASDLIERVVIIKEGAVILDEDTETLLAKGYTVSGPAKMVDDYIADKDLIGMESLGGLKTAYILGSVNKQELPSGLESSKLDLQKIFIQLTNV